MHGDVVTAMGEGLSKYAAEPHLEGESIAWRPAANSSGNEDVARPATNPFSETGGLQLVTGNIGRAVTKVSAVKPANRVVKAPAIVFTSQQQLLDRFKAGDLNKDFIAIVPFQGPKANGMPELHKLTPPLGVLQDKGFKVALVTDGRMSGASGKVPSAIHVTPEALDGGAIGKIQDGDIVHLDAEEGTLSVEVDDGQLMARDTPAHDLSADRWGAGRELFAGFRSLVGKAEDGAMAFDLHERAEPNDD